MVGGPESVHDGHHLALQLQHCRGINQLIIINSLKSELSNQLCYVKYTAKCVLSMVCEILFNLKVSCYHHTSLTLISCISCKYSLYKNIYIHMFVLICIYIFGKNFNEKKITWNIWREYKFDTLFRPNLYHEIQAQLPL